MINMGAGLLIVSLILLPMPVMAIRYREHVAAALWIWGLIFGLAVAGFVGASVGA